MTLYSQYVGMEFAFTKKKITVAGDSYSNGQVGIHHCIKNLVNSYGWRLSIIADKATAKAQSCHHHCFLDKNHIFGDCIRYLTHTHTHIPTGR